MDRYLLEGLDPSPIGGSRFLFRPDNLRSEIPFEPFIGPGSERKGIPFLFERGSDRKEFLDRKGSLFGFDRSDPIGKERVAVMVGDR